MLESIFRHLNRLVRVRTRGTSHGLRMAADGPSLVEQPVTADEAIELIGKAKTIIEADMGVKVYHAMK